MSTFIGHIPTKDLLDRYSFGKTKLYESLDSLGIERVSREGDRLSYISDHDLQLLDEYIHISNTQGKAAAKAFAMERKTADKSGALAVPNSGTPELNPVDMLGMLHLLQASMASPAEADPFRPQRLLREAAKERWLLSTQQVRNVVGVASWNGGDRYGFRFERVGKTGAQVAWKVIERDEQWA